LLGFFYGFLPPLGFAGERFFFSIVFPEGVRPFGFALALSSILIGPAWLEKTCPGHLGYGPNGTYTSAGLTSQNAPPIYCVIAHREAPHK
jgi:hypothetical protein